MKTPNDLIFYHIYALGFCDSLHKNDFIEHNQNKLKLIEEKIDHIKYLGCNAVYIGPVFESTFHGYDTIDYYNIDRRLGNNLLFKELVNKFHINNVKVIVDTVFNHVGREFWAFKDVLLHRENSKYCSWFCGLNFSSNNSYNDNFSYMGWHNNYDLVKLNLKNNFVKEHLFNAVKMWIEEFDIDGLRMDAADCMDMQFLQELSRYTKSINPNFFIFGEVVHGDYRRYVLEGELDSVTNYECYKGLFSSHNDINLFEIAYSLNRQFAWNGIYKNLPLYNFVDNHDVTRISSIIKKEEYIYTIYGLLFTMPGIPSIYYGSEFGIKGIKLDKSDLELRPSIKNINNSPAKNNDLANIISRLAHIRKTNSSLKNGSYLQVYLNHSQFAFLRENEEELILVVVNISNQNFSININYNFGRIIEFSDLLNKNEILYSTQNSLYIENLYPNWLRILRTPK